jgi:DNA-binding winged helix-turn-helix (wHTH) protein
MPDGLVVYRFGAFEFNPESRSLSRADARVTLPAPQAAILAHLLSHSGAVVPKDKLIDAGWPGLAVAENSLNQAVHR